MASSSGVVGVLRALLTADTAQFDTAMRKAVSTTQSTTTAIGGLTKEVTKLTPQAERMVKAFGGERQFAAANNLVAAIQRVGGATKLTEADQRRANATLNAALDRYRALGLEAPKAMLATERATRGASSASSVLSSTFATLTASFSTALIVNRVVGGLTSLVNESIRSAGALVDMSGKTGLSTETLQRMSFVAEQTGAQLDDFTRSAFQLGVRVATGSTEARAAFSDLAKSSDALGMSFEQFQKIRPDEQFARVTAALHDVQDEQERNRIGVALMGKTYQGIAAAVSENYNQMAKAARASSDQQVHAIDDAVDAWNAFIKAQSVGIQAGLGSAILWARALRQAVDEMGVFASTASVMARARFLIDEGLLTGRKTDIKLTAESAKAHQDYVAQLAALNAELKKLTPAQLAQIQAARQMGVSASDLEQQYGLTEGALALLSTRTKAYTADAKDQKVAMDSLSRVAASAFGLDTIQRATDMVNAIGGMAGLVLMDASALKSLNKLMTEAIDAAQRNGQLVPLEWLRIEDATRDNVGSLQEYLRTVRELPDAMRDIPPPPPLLPNQEEMNANWVRSMLSVTQPGAPVGRAAKEAGETTGRQINEGLALAFEQVPHFLTSSIIHSGSFINGLKAIGVDMADAIVEPLIKRIIAKIAGAKLIDAVSGGAAGAALGAGAAAGSSFVASEVAGTAAATTAAVGGAAAAGGVGAAGAAAGGGLGASLVAFATNPFTIAAAGGIAAFLAYRHFRNTTNDKRDKFLAQFAPFDTKRDANNPPGFYGAAAIATKAKHPEWFSALVGAGNGSQLKAAEVPFVQWAASQGRTLKMFNFGGFVPPGVVQPAILHGGAYGEDVTPRGPDSASRSGLQIVNHWHVSTIDAKGVREFVQSGDFTYHLGNVIERNHGFLTTAIRRAV